MTPRTLFGVLALVATTGCDLESLGAYACDDYCDSMAAKAEQCAQEQGVSFQEFAGAPRDEVLDSCDAEVEGQGWSDAECQLQTGVVNNSTCAEVAQAVAQMI